MRINEIKNNPNLPAIPGTYSISYSRPEPEAEEEKVPFSHYVWVLKRHRWRILAFVFICVLSTLVVAARLTPIYESTATVDIDRQTPTGLLGQDAVRSATNDADQFLATQIDLIQSDSVVRKVVQKLRLKEVDRDYRETVKTAEAEEAPATLKKLNVVRPPNTYLLKISYRSANPRLAADVANGIARSYLEHTYNIRYESSAGLSHFMEKQMEELKTKMEQSSAALAGFERELNVINPEEKTTILSARLLQLNSEYTNAQADRVRKESAHNSVKSGSLEAALISTQGESLKKLTEQFNEAGQRFEEIKLHNGSNHPEYKKAALQVDELERQLLSTKESIGQRVELEFKQAAERESMLRKAVAETKVEFDRVNARSFDYLALKREAEGDKKLYEELVRKIKEAGINAGFQNNSVRIADLARPAIKPVFPRTKLSALIAFLCSTLLAIGVAVIGDALDDTVRDPEQVARTLKTEVVGTLPSMKNWRGRLNPICQTDGGMDLVPLGEAGGNAATGYDEAIRTLRNSILLTDFERRLRSVLITSASPSEGKSTVAAHLAVAHAEQRHRTLLIDGDLRRPSLHKFFAIAHDQGLSDVLVTGLPWREAVYTADTLTDLDVLPAGPPSRRAADLIGKMLPRILEEAALTYDLIILDAPPLLGFPEPLQMAANVDGVIVVTRAGQTSRKAVSSVLTTLTRLRAKVVGLVLNEVSKEMGESYYYYGNYGKYSQSAAKAAHNGAA
ncbi:MAG: polysaccharide biosynthesis tyrosine autokinase [Acidobacteriota bacterium]|nr:polysaccharide biosynthesis tyrosine autokinase [Acidobacteriota bacterium]